MWRDHVGGGNSKSISRKPSGVRTPRHAKWLMLAAAPVIVGVIQRSSLAATDTWTGGGADNEWGTAGNFGASTPASGDDFVFGAGPTKLNTDFNLGTAFKPNSITFGTGAPSYNLSATTTVNMAGPIVDVSGNGSIQNISAGFVSAFNVNLGAGTAGGNYVNFNVYNDFNQLNVTSSEALASTATDVITVKSTGESEFDDVVSIGVTTSPAAGSTTNFQSYTGTRGTNTPGSGGRFDAYSGINVGFANTNGAVGANNVAYADLSSYSYIWFGDGPVNVGYGENVTGTLICAQGTASTNIFQNIALNVGNSFTGTGAANASGGSTISLGSGLNTWMSGSSASAGTNYISVGGGETYGTLTFYNATSGTFTLAAPSSGGYPITIASMAGGPAISSTPSSILFAGHKTNLSTGAITVGNNISGIGGPVPGAVFTFDTGFIKSASMLIGNASSGSSSGINASFVLGTSNASTGIVNDAGAFVLGNNQSPATVNANFTIKGGTANLSQGVTVQSNAGITNASINFSAGVLNLMGNGIGNTIGSGTLNFAVNFPSAGQSAILMNLGGSGIISNTGLSNTSNQGGLTMGDTGTLILLGTNTYSGTTTINSGSTLQIGSGAIGSSLPGGGAVINNGNLIFAGSVPLSIPSNIGGTGPISHNSSSTTTLSGSSNFTGLLSVNSGTLAISGSLNSTGSIAVNTGSILNVSGSVATSILNVNTGGILSIGNGGSVAETGVLAVNAGGLLTGTGSAGNVNLSGGGIHPGNTIADGDVGTLSVSSLKDISGDIRIDVTGNGTDMITDSGAATFAAGSTLTVAIPSGYNAAGTYTVLTAGSALTSKPTLSYAGIGRAQYSLAISGNSLLLSVTGQAASLEWGKLASATSGDGTTWDNSTNQNWNNGGNPDSFFVADNVTFDDNINNGSPTVNVGAVVAPATVTFSNNSVNYTLTGSGGINGSTGVTINGSGTVTIQESNSYTGDTNLNNGTLVLGTGGVIADTNLNINGGVFNVAGGALNATNLNINGGNTVNLISGTSTSAVTDNGNLNLAANFTVGALNGGSGTINLNGKTLTVSGTGSTSVNIQDGTSPGSLNVSTGTLDLTNAPNYTGLTNIVSGATLNLSTGSTVNLVGGLLGAGTLKLSGGNLPLSINNSAGSPVIPTSITIAASGTSIQNLGKLIISGTVATSTFGTTFNVASFPGTLSDGLAGDVELSGAVTRTSPGTGLLKTGPGTLILSGSADDASLSTTISGGVLLLNKNSSSAAHAIGGAITIANGGTLRLAGSGGDQIFDSTSTANGVLLQDGGAFDTNGRNESIGILTMGSSQSGVGATIENTAPGTYSLLTITTTFNLSGSTFANVAAGSTLEMYFIGANSTGNSSLITTDGPGTLVLSGTHSNSTSYLNASTGTVILAKTTLGQHAISSVYGVGPTAVLQLGSTTNDQLVDNSTGGASIDYGVLNLLGTFDMAGHSEGTDKVTGTGRIINSQSSTSTLTLGTYDGYGPTTPTFAGSVIGNINLGFNYSSSITGATSETNQILFTLSGTNSYIGTTTVNGAQLQVGFGGSTGNLGSGPIALNFGIGTATSLNPVAGTAVPAVLSFNRSDSALVVSSNISGVGSINQVGVGTTTLSGLNTYTGPTTVSAGILQISAAGALPNANASAGFHGTNLTIASGAKLIATHLTNGKAMQVGTLNNSGLINLTDNALDVYAGTASFSTIYGQVLTGYGAGSWNGTTGITSTDAASNTRHLTTLGVILNDNGSGTPLYGTNGTLATTFGGVTPQDNDVLVKYVYFGDTNLDGKVDGTDYSRIDAAFISGGTLTGWYNGDFNYDGVINGSDYTLIDNAFNTQGASLAAEVATATDQIAGGSTTAAVPEPTTLGLLGMGAVSLLGRRKRRHN